MAFTSRIFKSILPEAVRILRCPFKPVNRVRRVKYIVVFFARKINLLLYTYPYLHGKNHIYPESIRQRRIFTPTYRVIVSFLKAAVMPKALIVDVFEHYFDCFVPEPCMYVYREGKRGTVRPEKFYEGKL